MIIEESVDYEVGPYNHLYDGLEADLQECGLSLDNNHWQSVNDLGK